MKGKLLFLGTGNSVGVPIVGCSCPVCHSSDPRNKRLRSSVLISTEDKNFIIDVGPDFREQALKFGIEKLDGVLITHIHYDHTAGLGDLRPFCFHREKPLPLLMSEQSFQDIKIRFSYLFETESREFEVHLLPSQPSGVVYFENIPIQYVTYEQSRMSVNGFKIGNLAYISDIRRFPENIFNSLAGVKTLVISALKFVPSHLHFSVDEAVDFANKLKAEKVWLTHLSHEIDYTHTASYLPQYVRVAYDGLVIDFDYGL